MKNDVENCEYLDLESILLKISSKKPECCKSEVITQEGYYKNGDPCIMFYLKNKACFFIRIWAAHMDSFHEGRKLTTEGKIFFSASRIEGRNKTHLPLYGWFQNNDYSGIWGRILEK